MKTKISLGVCVLIALALVVFGILFGTMSGYEDDRARVTALVNGENGLMDMLGYRAADGLNLCVVAKRHLSGDSDVAALGLAAKMLQNESGSLMVKKQEDTKLAAALNAVSTKLQATPSFQQSIRDQKYLDMLTTDFQNFAKSTLVNTYNVAAADFNAQFNIPVIGDIAKLLGVKPCELYE